MQKNEWLNISVRLIKVILYGVIFCVVLCSSLIAKGTVIFSIAQLEEENSVEYCDYYSGIFTNFDYHVSMNAKNTKEGKIIWTWYIIFMFLIPECFVVLYTVWNIIFKKIEEMPKKQSIIILFFLETLHPVGLALLIFYSLPKINSVDVAAISSCICFIPALLNLLSQNCNYTSAPKLFILTLMCNILALASQGSGIIIQFILYYNVDHSLGWILPVSLLLSSCRWWNNYVSIDSYCGFIRYLASVKMDLMNRPHLLQGCIAFWRSFIFILSVAVITTFKGVQIGEFFKFIPKKTYSILLVENSSSSVLTSGLTSHYSNGDAIILNDNISTPLYVFLIHSFCALFVYEAVIVTAKFAYKTQMHKFSFALPINLTTPGAIFLIFMFCILRKQDVCVFHTLIPDFLFFKAPSYNRLTDFLLSWRLWCWIIWWLSQIWITIQLWLGENERLASTKKIFYNSTYDSLIIDQFFGLNKRKHESYTIIEEEEDEDTFIDFEINSINDMCRPISTSDFSKESANNKKNVCVTQIYACATMWHEKKQEMNELIGSILRLDKDQCALKVTQKYYKIFIKDYYELETHIFFDDAFCCVHCCSRSCDHNENEVQMNEYVITFIETMQEKVRNLGTCSSMPIKYPTPYGGQLVWILPGKTRLTVHLKDKNKIRHRKRWSQVMYMYYLLGYRLMSSSMDVDQKELLAQNSYILTLDGDIDFRPAAVKSLIDFMKKDKELGAACGRIHPVGKGPMIWFQKFEYALGHWLQKSTEHITGSVLCSPGCFSLFRAKALMQHNVLAKYATKSTEPRHFIQYDQGEDRWLCTLILQTGGRVEYCAASDAYTHAPESFQEFYLQRRRWIPSTIANIFDLLSSSKETRQLNNNISWLYIIYQTLLTGGTIIGPSFIYLMMVGAFVECFHIDNWTSFWYNTIPLIIFLLICSFTSEHIQLITAEIMTVVYGLIMIVVLVGIILQVAIQGYFAPNTLLFFIVIGQFILTSFMHPQEWSCINNAIIYYITVPSMYMLLIIYSIFNVHNVTWGTRESIVCTKASETKSTKTNNSHSEQGKENSKDTWLHSSFSNLFKCYCPSHTNSKEKEKYLNFIYNTINEINIRLDQIERNCNNINIIKDNNEEKHIEENTKYMKHVELQVTEDSLCQDTDSKSEVSAEVSESCYQKYSNYLVNPYWFQNECIKNGQVDFLSTTEENFWKQLIEKYLYPIENDVEKQRNIKRQLIDIRNEYLLKFFTINTLFVVAIFLLQINKEVLYIQWPFAVHYNITFIKERDEIHIFKNYMHLEPIGCLFICAYVLILLIQFLAMCVHRFSTFTHVLANVKLNLFCCEKVNKSSNVLVTNKHAKDIAEGLQNAVEHEVMLNINKFLTYSRTGNTVHELVEDVQSPPIISDNLETLFHKKLREPEISGFSSNVPKDAMEVLENHRSKIIAERKKLQSPNETYESNGEVANTNGKKKSKNPYNYQYDNPTFLNDE
ncbi:chitin synthase chs-2 [Calliopsis andreniformis]|uniref:chitin synthase chs-2 n=1 Tax=Calliopsis andreniformis TaxID=337506 RepID=UPI003FCCD223